MLLVASLTALAPATAWANAGQDIIRQCLATDSVSGHYTQQDYQYALSHLPSDVAEYSDCQDVIRRAELAAAGGKTGLTGANGTTVGAGTRDPYATASRSERAAVVAAQRNRPVAVQIGSSLVEPGTIAVRPSSFIHDPPTPLLVALASVLLAAAALGGGRVLRFVRSRR